MSYYDDELFECNTVTNTSSDDDSLMTVKRERVEKEQEKGHFKISRKIDNQFVKIDVFTGGFIPGSYIRNAITGYLHNYKVGSLDENLYFKVCIAEGISKKREPLILFFDSPESYERHFNTTIDVDFKKRWNEKKILELQRRRRLEYIKKPNSIMEEIQPQQVTIVK